MTGERKKLGKMSLTGFLLSFVSPVYLALVCVYSAIDPNNGFPALLLWSIIGFWVAQAAHTFSEIGIIICAVKKKRGIALSVIGIVISNLIMFVAVAMFCVLLFHESPPSPPQGY